MDFINFLLYLLFGASLVLAFFIFSRGKKRQSLQSFALLTLAGAIWAFSIAMFRRSDAYSQAQVWDWVIYWSGMLSAPSFLWFTQVFPFKEEGIPLKYRLAIFTPTVLLAPLVPTKLFIVHLDLASHHVTLGPLYILWMLTFFIFYAFSFSKLIQSYRRSSGLKRLQLKYILYSLSLPGIFSSLFNVILPFLGYYQLIWIGPFFMMTMVAIVSFAIVRYRLMDLRIIARDTTTKILTVVILSSVCALASVLYGVTSGYPVHKEVAFPIIGAMIFVVFTFNFFFNRVTIFTRKFIIKGGYDPELLLKHLTNTLASTIGFEKMLNSLLKVLVEGLNIKFASIILVNPSRSTKPGSVKVISFGEKVNQWTNPRILIEYFEAIKGPIFREEVHKEVTPKRDGITWPIISEMTKKGIALILPLAAKNELTGFLLLGEKPASDAYTANDLGMLETFASQASFAIENARLFTEIQNFNEVLRDEVKKATLELREQNRFLAALRRLDLIIMETLELEKLCQKIVNALSSELKCQFGLIGLIDEVKNRFYFKAVTGSSDFSKLLSKKGVGIDDFFYSLDHEKNTISGVINNKKEASVASLAEFLPPAITKKRAKNWQAELKNRTFWLYPIKSKTRVLGILVFGWKKSKREISSKEKDLMQSVIDQTGIALDNTLLYEKLKDSVEKLKKANLKLRELDRMKSEFVSISSHELRTPMTSVNNYIWMVLNGKAGKISKKQRFYLERASTSTKRLIHLVEDMLTISRIEGGKINVDAAPGSIVTLSKAIFSEMGAKAKKEKVKLSFKPPKKELPLVMMDKEKIQEVLINLIDNAIKFTPPGGEVAISFKKKSRFVSTIVTDTGRGIARVDIPKLFKKFGRLDRSFATVAETSGTGLGLYICKQIVDLHRGKIGVRSKPGEGSTFHFELRTTKEVKKISE